MATAIYFINSIYKVCANSALVKDEPCLFLALPNVPRDIILSFLREHTLKNLRLVSKTTKQWVDNAQNFQIYVDSLEMQESLVCLSKDAKYNPWTRFIIKPPGREEGNELELLPTFMNSYGSLMTHLVIKRNAKVSIPDLLGSLSSNIVSLKIAKIPDMIEVNDESCGHCMWKANLINLKELRISVIKRVVTNTADAIFYNLFACILQNCSSNLTYLKLPSVSQFLPTNPLVAEELVIHPLLDYLRRIGSERTVKEKIGLEIDLIKLSTISQKCLRKLVKTSIRIGTKFRNVPSTGLPFENDAKLTPLLKNMYDMCIISCRPTVNSSLHLMYISPGTKLGVKLISQEDCISFLQLTHPVHTLVSNKRTFPDFDDWSAIFQMPRPSVTEFRGSWSKRPEESPLLTLDLCRNLPNLTCLSISYVENDDMNAFLSGAPLLNKLIVSSSINICDKGLLGYRRDPNFPLICQLRHLTHLELLDMDFITNAVFTLAIRHMKLKIFKWTTTCFASQNPRNPNLWDMNLYPSFGIFSVTLLGGISSLTTIPGAFRDTIEDLEISKIWNTKPDQKCVRVPELDEILNRFTNLRSFRINMDNIQNFCSFKMNTTNVKMD